MSRRPIPSQRALALFTALLAVCAGALTTTQTAAAGEYRVFACQLQNGTAVGLGDWTLGNNAIRSDASIDACASQGLTYSQLGPEQTGTTSWSGVGIAMPDSSIVATSIRGNRWVKTLPGGGPDHSATPGYQLRSGQSGNQWFSGTTVRDQCRYIDGCANIAWDDRLNGNFALDFPGGASWVGLAVACLQEGAPDGACASGGGGRVHLRINRLDLTVQEYVKPIVSSESGSLLQGGARSGSQSLTFAATDVGAGIYQAIVQVDGNEIGRIYPDPSPTCRDAGGLPENDQEFTRLQPCSRSLGVSFDVDTTRIANGNHRVTAFVRDAAGNLSNLISRDVTINNAPAPAPTPTTTPVPTVAPRTTPTPVPTLAPGTTPTPVPTLAPGETPTPGSPNGGSGDLSTGTLGRAGEAKSVSTRFGVRPTITGRLLDGKGNPIARAQLDVFERVELPARAWTKVGTAETDVAGKYRFKPLAGSSKRVRLSYATVVGSDAYRSTREVRVSVAAAMSIAARPSVVRRRGTIRLIGKVQIDELPRRGVSVEVQVKRSSGWSAVGTRPVGKDGSWNYTRRLQTAANATLQFRARLIPANDVAAGESKSASVKVRIR